MSDETIPAGTYWPLLASSEPVRIETTEQGVVEIPAGKNALATCDERGRYVRVHVL